MKWHLSNMAQILLGLAPAALVAGMAFPAMVPAELARPAAVALLLLFLTFAGAFFVLTLLLAGMSLERRAHGRKASQRIARAARNQSAAAGAPFKSPAHDRSAGAAFRRRTSVPVADGDAVSALVHLGFTNTRAAEAVARAAGELGAGIETGALIRQALKGLTP